MKNIFKQSMFYVVMFITFLCVCGFDCEDDSIYTLSTIENSTDDTIIVFSYVTPNSVLEVENVQFIFRLPPHYVREQSVFNNTKSMERGIIGLLSKESLYNCDSVLLFRRGYETTIWKSPFCDTVSNNQHYIFNLKSWVVNNDSTEYSFTIYDNDFVKL